MSTKPARPPRKTRAALRVEDLRGVIHAAVDAIVGVTRIAQGLHGTIASGSSPVGRQPERPAGGIAGFVYGTVRTSSRVVGKGLDAVLAKLQAFQPAPAEGESSEDSETRAAIVAALNGVAGHQLAKSGNPLAIRMALIPRAPARPRVLLLVHGLCMHDGQWTRAGHDHGLALARALDATPVYLKYNSGRHVSENGSELASMLESMLADWPVPIESLAIIGHSMGGLVARSSVHQARGAGMRWPDRLTHLITLGTPHHGAPLERGGNWLHQALGLSPYLAPFGRLTGLRSDGITDLRHGNLLEADWQGGRFVQRDTRKPLALPQGVKCCAVAGTLVRGEALLGDGLVAVDSALGQHPIPSQRLRFPPSHTLVARGVDHLDLLSSEAVYQQLLRWFAPS